MRLTRSVLGFVFLLVLTRSAAANAQLADGGRIAVSRETAPPASDTVQRMGFTTVAESIRVVHPGKHIAIGAVFGAVAGITWTAHNIQDCRQTTGHGETGLCGLEILSLPYTVGTGAIAGGLLGWLHAASER